MYPVPVVTSCVITAEPVHSWYAPHRTIPHSVKYSTALTEIAQYFSFFLPIRLNLRGGHQTRFGIQVQRVGRCS